MLSYIHRVTMYSNSMFEQTYRILQREDFIWILKEN